MRDGRGRSLYGQGTRTYLSLKMGANVEISMRNVQVCLPLWKWDLIFGNKHSLMFNSKCSLGDSIVTQVCRSFSLLLGCSLTELLDQDVCLESVLNLHSLVYLKLLVQESVRVKTTAAKRVFIYRFTK